MTTPTVQITGEVIVQKCTVTLVRRGGWSWGPDPRSMVPQVLDTLPDLLGSQFAEYLAGDGPDVEITEPVILTVRLGQGLRPAIESASIVPVTVPVDGPDPESFSVEESFMAESSWSPATVAVLLAELAERGDLEPLFALLPDESVRVYLLALLTSADSPDDSAVVSRVLAEFARRMFPDIQTLTRSSTAPVTPAEREDLIRLVESLPGRPSADRPRAGVVSSPATGEVRVCSVLPFLLAGPLARTGYLDAIGPALAGVDLAEDAPLFAAGLAYKVLGVTERGWRRSEQDRAAAAAFAGFESPVPDEVLAGFARHVRPALPVLDGVLALSLSRGHDPAEPLLITGVAGDGLLVADAHGMFPIAWADDVAGLLPHWQACGRPPVLVCDSPLPPECLTDLAAAGVRFVTDVRPLRGDPVSRLPWRSPLWTFGDPDPRLASDLPVHASRLGDLVRTMVVERRAVPLAQDNALDRSVTLAATLGLGMIAWMLWRDRETPDPVLTLTRFADLEATVRFSPDAVRVRVPLGRRHTDLLRSGLLSDVPHVVWLGGRTLTFSGG